LAEGEEGVGFGAHCCSDVEDQEACTISRGDSTSRAVSPVDGMDPHRRLERLLVLELGNYLVI
jgi:hypothetical protein